MNRRTFLCSLTHGTLAAALAAEAQTAEKVYRVGILSGASPVSDIAGPNPPSRSVSALLEELAPERVLKRGEERIKAPVEQHRTPTGCVLQAADSAVSVSWFVATGRDLGHGELHVVVWRGTVARRGATSKQRGAKIIAELSLHPIAPPGMPVLWEATDGTRYDAPSLAEKCLALLEGQISKPA